MHVYQQKNSFGVSLDITDNSSINLQITYCTEVEHISDKIRWWSSDESTLNVLIAKQTATLETK